MLVINGELVAVARKRVPGHVVGDGDQHDRAAGGGGEPRPAARHRAREGADPAGVRPSGRDDAGPEGLHPGDASRPAGEQVFLRSTGNLSTGGTATDMTDVVHPDNVEMAVRAVKAIGLDVGGVDFLTHRHHRVLQGGGRRDLRDQRGARLPDAHGAERGRPRDVAGPVMDMLFPPGTPEPDPDRRGDRHQRQDHHGADAGPHPQAGRAPRRAHHHRRRLHRRPAHRERRHDRAGRHPHGAERPLGGRGGAGDRPRRAAARRDGRPPLRRGRGAQREVRPPRASAASARWRSWPR